MALKPDELGLDLSAGMTNPNRLATPPAEEGPGLNLGRTPYQMLGVERVPIAAASGKAVLTDILGHGLGWDAEDQLDAYTASSRMRSFLNAQKGIRSEGTPDIPVTDAVDVARQKLGQARDQLMGHMQQGPQMPPGMPQEQRQGYLDRMYPKMDPARRATYEDVPETTRWLTAGYALARLLRGDSIGEAAQFAAMPLNDAQKRVDEQRRTDLQNMATDAERARAEFGLDQRDIELQRAEATRKYGEAGKLYMDQFDEAQRVFRETTAQNLKAMNAEDRDLFKKALDGNVDSAIRTNALDMLYGRGKIGDQEYRSYTALASQKGSKELANEALAEQRRSSAGLNAKRTELLPREQQLKAGELARRKAKDEVDAKFARERLRIMDDRNQITLNLGVLRDGTANRRIDLEVPLMDARIADYLDKAESRKDGTLKGLVQVYDSRLKEMRTERQQVQDDLTAVYKALASKDVRKSAAVKQQFQEQAEEIEARLRELDRRMATYEGERNELADDLIPGATPEVQAAKGAKAGAGGFAPVSVSPPSSRQAIEQARRSTLEAIRRGDVSEAVAAENFKRQFGENLRKGK